MMHGMAKAFQMTPHEVLAMEFREMTIWLIMEENYQKEQAEERRKKGSK